MVFQLRTWVVRTVEMFEVGEARVKELKVFVKLWSEHEVLKSFMHESWEYSTIG